MCESFSQEAAGTRLQLAHQTLPSRPAAACSPSHPSAPQLRVLQADPGWLRAFAPCPPRCPRFPARSSGGPGPPLTAGPGPGSRRPGQRQASRLCRSPPGQARGCSRGTPRGRSAPLPGGCGSAAPSPPCPTAPCCRSGCAVPRSRHRRTEPRLCSFRFPASLAAFWGRCPLKAPRCPPAPSRSQQSGRRTLRDAGSRVSPPRHRGPANPQHLGQGTGSVLLVELGSALLGRWIWAFWVEFFHLGST